MRLFKDIFEAGREIERDLSKSPQTKSKSVQNIQQEILLKEALGYSYSISDPVLPQVNEVVDYAVEMGFIRKEDRPAYFQWCLKEMINRSSWQPHQITEKDNPHLQSVIEGYEPSYTYTDRLRGSQQLILETLISDPGSRRAYFPIFIPEDAVRATRATRIPCSIGYQLLIREIDDIKYLTMVYLERSCDFRRFWIWDVYLAKVYQTQVCEELRQSGLQVQVGVLMHFITSFHIIQDSSEEVY